MTFHEGDLVLIDFVDHTHNFGKLMRCQVVGFFSHEDAESITIDSWKTKNTEAQDESFTIAWACISCAYRIDY